MRTSPETETTPVPVPLAPGSAQPALIAANDPHTREHPRPGLLYLAITIMIVFWTLNLPVGKIALLSFPPLMLISLRTILAAVFILPVYLFANPSRRRMDVGDVPGMIGACLLGQIGNQVLFVIGLSHTSVSHTAFIFSLVPILVLLLAAWVGQEQITKGKLAGMVISATGVVLLTFDKSGGGGPTLFGDAFDFLSACAFSYFTVMSKPYRNRYGPVTVSLFSYGSGTIALLPVVLYYLLAGGFQFQNVTNSGWTSLLYMAVFPAVIGYIIYFYALGYLTASRLSTFNYLQPPLATALGVMFLDEPLTPMLLLGGSFILAGVAVTERG